MLPVRALLICIFFDAAGGLSSCTENLQPSLDNHLSRGAFDSDAAFAAHPPQDDRAIEIRMTGQFSRPSERHDSCEDDKYEEKPR